MSHTPDYRGEHMSKGMSSKVWKCFVKFFVPFPARAKYEKKERGEDARVGANLVVGGCGLCWVWCGGEGCVGSNTGKGPKGRGLVLLMQNEKRVSNES